jgi:hypothetical protein
MGLEQRDSAAGLDYRANLADDGLHVAFMGLVRAVYIEEFEPGPLRGARPSVHYVLDHPPIDDMFAPAIGVERAQRSQCRRGLVVAEAGTTVAIGGGGRSVDKVGRVGGAPLPKVERQANIVGYEPVDICFSR